jgi:hypothetical protein
MSDSPIPTTTAAPRPAVPPFAPPAQQGAQTAPPKPAASVVAPLTPEQITAMIAQAVAAMPPAAPSPASSRWTEPVIVAGVFSTLLAIIVYAVAVKSDGLITNLSMGVFTLAATIVNFFWGSSQGSRDKDARIAAQASTSKQ